MSILFKRDDKKVIVTMSNGPLDFSFDFTFECGSNWSAELLREHYSKKFWEAIKEVRKSEYERGWKHAKQKRKKADWWKANLDTREY